MTQVGAPVFGLGRLEEGVALAKTDHDAKARQPRTTPVIFMVRGPADAAGTA